MSKRKYGPRKCEAEECETIIPNRTLCNKHYSRLYRNGSPDALRGPHRMPGESNPSWLGDEINYSAAHERVRKINGPASAQQCCQCGKQAAQWAYSHLDKYEKPSAYGPYSPNPRFYVPMCVSCHKLFDLRRLEYR